MTLSPSNAAATDERRKAGRVTWCPLPINILSGEIAAPGLSIGDGSAAGVECARSPPDEFTEGDLWSREMRTRGALRAASVKLRNIYMCDARKRSDAV